MSFTLVYKSYTKYKYIQNLKKKWEVCQLKNVVLLTPNGLPDIETTNHRQKEESHSDPRITFL